MADTTTSQSRLPFTAKEALAMTNRKWHNAIATLTARQQVILASDIVSRLQHRADLARFRALCKAAAGKQEQEEEQNNAKS